MVRYSQNEVRQTLSYLFNSNGSRVERKMNNVPTYLHVRFYKVTQKVQ